MKANSGDTFVKLWVEDARTDVRALRDLLIDRIASKGVGFSIGSNPEIDSAFPILSDSHRRLVRKNSDCAASWRQAGREVLG